MTIIILLYLISAALIIIAFIEDKLQSIWTNMWFGGGISFLALAVAFQSIQTDTFGDTVLIVFALIVVAFLNLNITSSNIIEQKNKQKEEIISDE